MRYREIIHCALIGICGVMLGFWYERFLAFNGCLLLGAGHGTGFFMELGTSPFDCGKFIWPIMGGLIVLYETTWIRRALLFLLASHYVGIVFELMREPELGRVWESFFVSWDVLFWQFSVYLIWQVFVVWVLLKEEFKNRRAKRLSLPG